jgi:arylsulfatase A
MRSQHRGQFRRYPEWSADVSSVAVSSQAFRIPRHSIIAHAMNSQPRLLTCSFLGVLATWVFVPAGATVAEDRRPNVVVVLADDFGVGDIQAHYPENKIATPHLDRLVREGMSFTDAHSSSAVCSPTRYGLLTGRYNWRTRLQEWVIAAYEPPLIAADRPTLPGMLRQQGYRTGCIGKWHLGWDWPGRQPSRMTEKRNGQAFLPWDFTKPVQGGPTARGFDDFFGVDLPNLPPFTFIQNDRAAPLPTAKFQPDPGEGIVLPRQFAGTPAAPDWRMQDILPTITERAVRYIHDRAQEPSPFCLYFSLTSPHEPVVPSPKFQGKSGIAPIADFVMETDWSVGQMMKAIDAAGIADHTIVVFTADNGHSHYTGWQELIDAGHQPSGPYRGHKGDIWEGGHRVPLVVRWPGHIEAAAKSDQLVCLTDLFATCADVVGAELPANGAEDSISFLPALLGTPPRASRTSVVSHSNFGEFAYRDGPWKLVFRMSGPNLEASRGKPTIAELYNLHSTIAETEDLSTRHPEIVARMTRDLEEVIGRGATRAGLAASNDTDVRFDTTQTQRWAPAADPNGPVR